METAPSTNPVPDIELNISCVGHVERGSSFGSPLYYTHAFSIKTASTRPALFLRPSKVIPDRHGGPT